MKPTSLNRLFQSKYRLILLSVLLASAMPWSARAGINSIGIDLNQNSGVNNMQPDDLAGAPGVRTTNWNNLNLSTASVTLSSLNDNSGNTVPGMSATIYPYVFSTFGSSSSLTNDARLYSGACDTQPSATTENSLVLTGIPYTNYLIFCYRSVEGSVTAPRGGYFSIRDVATNITYTTNLDQSVGTNTVYVTNFNSTAWISGPNATTPSLSAPANTGTGYVLSTTTVQPTNMSQIQAGNYVVLPGDPNPIISYTTNIDLNTLTTNVVATTNDTANLYYTPVGNGLRGVAGGDTVQRLKPVGFQIVQIPMANLTNITLSTVPLLLAGNPGTVAVTATGQYDDGTSFPLNVVPGTTFSSQDTNIFDIDSHGAISPRNAGTTNLVVTYGGISTTGAVTVLAPSVVRVSLSPGSLFIGGGTAQLYDSAAASVFADFGAAALTNSAYSNVNVTAFSYVSYATSPTSVATVTPAGVVTAVGAGSFTLTSTYAGLTSSNTVDGSVTVVTPSPTISAISVHITDNTNQPPAGSPDAMNFRYLSGAPGVRLAYWNNFLYTSTSGVTNTYSGFYDSKGNIISGMSISINAYSQGANNGGIGIVNNGVPYSGTSGRTTNESVMFNTYYDQGRNNPSSTAATDSGIVISNVPYSSYDAYFYFFNDSSATNRPGRVIIDGNTYWRKNYVGGSSTGGNYSVPDNNGNGYLQAVTPAGFPTYPTLSQIPNGNYIKVTGLTDPNLAVTWGAASVDIVGDAQSVTRMRLAGFQIVQSLSGLTATNLYLGGVIPPLFAGDPTPKPLTVLADFVGGITGGNVTALFTNYVSSDTNVFMVDTNGVVLAGGTPGQATLTITYQTNVLVKILTNLGPLSVTVGASPATEYNDGYLGLVNAQATALATFPGYTNVNIGSFSSVSFVDTGSAVASMDATGVIYPSGTAGTAALAVSYLGVNYTNNAFTVRSINDPPILEHRYSFRDATGSSVVTDSVGGANGTVYPALGGHQAITLDGERANFPGDADYTTAPYIALPPNLLTSMGDVTIDCWFTIRTNADWARIFDFGFSSKGTDPHASGSSSTAYTSMYFSPKPGGNNAPAFTVYLPVGTVPINGTNANVLAVGVEHHATLVYAPNQGLMKMYIDGVLDNTATPLSGGTLNNLIENNSWLGVSDWNDPTLNGSIDEFRIYEGAFTDAEVASDDAAGPDSGLSPVVSTVPTNVVASVSGGNLNLSWPTDHTGWRLQVQTNSLGGGLGTNWYDWPGSTNVNSVSIPIAPGNPSVFFRMVYP